MNIASFSYLGNHSAFKEEILSMTDIVNAYFKTKITVDFYTDQKKFLDTTTSLLTEEFFQKSLHTYKAVFTDQMDDKRMKNSGRIRLKLFHAMNYDLAIRPVIMYHESTSSLKGIQVPDVRLYLCRETRLRPVSLNRDTHYPGRDFEVISDQSFYPVSYMKKVISCFLELSARKHAEDVVMVLPVAIKSSIFKKWALLFDALCTESKMPSLILTVQEFWKSFTETPQKFRWIFAPDPLGDMLFYSLNMLLNKGFFSCYALMTDENKFYIENITEFYKGVLNYRSPLNVYHALAMLYDLLDMMIPARVLRRGIYEAMDKGWLTPEMNGTMSRTAVSGLYTSFVDKELSENVRT
jgi:hypothetical protein